MRLPRWLPGLVALVLAAGPASAGVLRVATFNVFHGGADSGLKGDAAQLDRRLEMAVGELRRVDADIIGLQEASAGRGRGNVAARMAEALGLHHAWAPATRRVFFWPLGRIITFLMNFDEGPAVLSRFPIVATAVHDLPACTQRIDPRVALEARLATPWGEVAVFSTHTSRDECQVRRVAEIVRSRRGGRLTIVTGDLNTPETSPAIAALTNGGGFVDAFRAANPSAPGPTVWQRIDAEESTVRRRVDYVLLLPGNGAGPRVRESRVILDSPLREPGGATLWPSDHYGVLAEIELAPVTTAGE